MSDLVAWLTKILDEDEKAANRAGGSIAEMQNDNYGQLLVPHAWVLADIAAKRAVIAECQRVHYAKDREYGDGSHDLADEILHLLASAYADRPGYDEGWRP